MKPHLLVLLAAALPPALPGADPASAVARLSLDGEWAFRLDPDRKGEAERWQSDRAAWPDNIRVPGAWDAQGRGEKSERLFTNHVGQAWYRREVEIPAEWAARRIWLELGGIHRYADVWVDGENAARCAGYLAPFTIEVTKLLHPGGKDLIAIRVDGRQDPSIDALTGCMDVIDAMDIQWGGLWRSVSLFTTGGARIEDAWVHPHLAGNIAVAEVKIELAEPAADGLEFGIGIADPAGSALLIAPSKIEKGALHAKGLVEMPEARLWSPRDPYLYTATVRLASGHRILDERSFRFGFRAIEARGNDIYLNGRRIFLRGYGDDCIFPHTIAPPADKEFHRRRFEKAREYGFNYVRHHSWWPPEEYLQAADETGFLLQPEFPIAYLNFYRAASEGAKRLYLSEWRRAIRRSRSHPSVISYSMGNEIFGEVDMARELYRIAKDLDPTRFVVESDGAALPTKAVVDAKPPTDIFSVQFDDGGKFGWQDGKYEVRDQVLRPVLVHEMGNFGTFPDFRQIDRYRDGIRPFWLIAARELARKKGISEGDLQEFVKASQRLQAVAAKANIEAARRSGAVDGYSYWLLCDYWTGSNGILNPFYEDKAWTTEEFRLFNSPTVLLLDRSRASFRSGEKASFAIHASRFEDPPSLGKTLRWSLRKGAAEIERGELKDLALSEGLEPLGEIALEFPNVDRPEKLRLECALEDPAAPARNSWDFWVFPKAGDLEEKGIVEKRLTSEGLDRVAGGGSLVLLGARLGLPTTTLRYKPLWWLGDPAGDSNLGTIWRASPLLGAFPQEGFGDLQTFGLLQGGLAYDIESLPSDLRPAVQAADLPTALRKRALLFEIGVGKGRLIVCGLKAGLELRRSDPAAAFLFAEILRSSWSEARPAVTISPGEARRLLIPRPLLDLKPGEVRGFGKVLECTLGSIEHPTHEEGEIRQGHLVRQTDGRAVLSWETAPVPAGTGPVTFAWVAGTGWVSEPEGRFSFSVNGLPLLDFGVSLEDRTWRSADGTAALEYRVRRVQGVDSLGVMRLVIPRSNLTEGKPARIRVTGSNSGSRRWFLLFDDGR